MNVSGGAQFLLVIETSTAVGSLAVFREGECIKSASFRALRGHNSRIYQPLRELLAELPRFDQLGAILVGTGPGSYTGVRVGIAVAIALAASGRAQLDGLTSLAGLLPACDDYVVAGDARRQTFYLARILGGRLNGDIEVLKREPWEERIAALRAQKVPLISTDALSPAAGIPTGVPTAETMGARYLTSMPSGDENEDGSRTKPVEPLYLAAPFITQPRKPGKAVGPAPG